jgi:TFIIF-interacting CTD phosphatase-like protein
MACYFNYFVDSVERSNDNVILKIHAEKEIQIVFTECYFLLHLRVPTGRIMPKFSLTEITF